MAEHHSDGEEQRIRARIEQRRIRMGAVIEEVGSHLNPDHLKDEFRTGMREQVEQTKRDLRGATIGRAETLINDMEDTVNRTSRTLMDTIRDNPLPAAMAGIGLGWLIVDARRHDSHDEWDHRSSGSDYDFEGGGYPTTGRDYDRHGVASTAPGYVGPYGRTAPPMSSSEMRGGQGFRSDFEYESEGRVDRAKDAVSDRAHDLQDRASEAADQVRDAAGRVQENVSDAADQVRHRASEMTDRVEDAWHDAEHRARRAGSEVRQLSEENPLAAGAVALALGFAAGMMVPETSRERQWMGPARDRMVNRAQEAAGETMEKVGRVVEATAEEARDTAEEEAKRQGLMGDDSDRSRDDFPGSF